MLRLSRALLVTALMAVLFSPSSPRVAAQEISTAGSEFYLAFTPYQGGPDWPQMQSLYLSISAAAATSGVVNFTDPAFTDIPFSVAAGDTITVELPRGSSTDYPHPATAAAGISDSSIRVTADKTISLYASWWVLLMTDAMLVPPTQAGGTLFVVPSYASPSAVSSFGANTAGFYVVAHEDNTRVTYVPRETAPNPYVTPQTTELYLSGAPDYADAETITLNRGQVFVYETVSSDGDNERDPSGSLIESDKPISAYGYSTCAKVPFGIDNCDYLIESLPPVTTWGTEYIAPPAANRTYQDTYRGYAWQDNTVISLDDSELTTLAAGEFFEYRQAENEALHFVGSQPFMLVRYLNSQNWDTISADPAMLMMLSPDMGLSRIRFTTGNNQLLDYTHTLTIVRPRNTAVTLNGAAVNGWQSISGTDFDYTVVEDLPAGAHVVSSSGLLQVYVSGLRSLEAYAYPAGIDMTPRWRPDARFYPLPAEDVTECALTPDMAVSPQFIELAPGGTATVEIAMRNLCNDAPYFDTDLLVSFSDGLRVIDGSNGMLNLSQRAAWQQFTLAAGETRRWTVTVQADQTLVAAPLHISELYHLGRVVSRIDGVFITPAAVVAAPATAEPVPAVAAVPAEPAQLPTVLPNTAGERALPWLLGGLALALTALTLGRRLQRRA